MFTLPLVLTILAMPQQMPADMAAYIEEIRKSGVTEDAKGSIEMVVSIMVGDELLEFPKDPESGEYGNSYHSASCMKPGLSSQEIEAIRTEAAKRRAPVLPRLREYADADHSGFVSTAEGWALRKTYTFGVKLSALVAKEGVDRAHLSKLLHVTPEEFERELGSYEALVKAMTGVEVRVLPPVPSGIRSQRERA